MSFDGFSAKCPVRGCVWVYEGADVAEQYAQHMMGHAIEAKPKPTPSYNDRKFLKRLGIKWEDDT